MYVWMYVYMNVCMSNIILQGSGCLPTLSNKAYFTYASDINVIKD